ncbi:MAG: translation initiation factor [Ferruginibacter sp.]
MAKNKPLRSGIVYSTDPDFDPSDPDELNEPVPAAEQKIKVRLETKHRAGKAVTFLEGFSGSHEEKETVSKKLKSFCGTGGSLKNGEIIIQGDNRDKILQWLLNKGYKLARKI